MLALWLNLLCFFTLIFSEYTILRLLEARARLDYTRSWVQAQIQWARMQALVLSQTVWLCPSVDQVHCHGQWKDPWVIRTQDRVLKVLPGIHSSIQLSWKSSFSKNAWIGFQKTGYTLAQRGRLCLDTPWAPQSCIVIVHTGLIHEAQGHEE